jgi:hypothetical protein
MLPTRETVHSERTDGDYQFEAQRLTENGFAAAGVIFALKGAASAIPSDELLLEALPSWRPGSGGRAGWLFSTSLRLGIPRTAS